MAKRQGTSGAHEGGGAGDGAVILHNVEKGVARLTGAPRDLPEAWPRPEAPPALAAAPAPFRELFAEYERALAPVVDEALRWWGGRLAVTQEREGVTRRQALRMLYEETVAGPASAPQVVWVVRTYWLACEELNRAAPARERVPPETFLISWLDDGRHRRALEVLSGMTYWPIGLDADGNWV